MRQRAGRAKRERRPEREREKPVDPSAARESDIPTQDRPSRGRVGEEGKYNIRREPIGISAMALAGLHVKCVLPVTCPCAPPAHGVSVVAPSLWQVVVWWWWWWWHAVPMRRM
eukprot:scaffold154672_cov38-Attheya_sp.AAC.1